MAEAEVSPRAQKYKATGNVQTAEKKLPNFPLNQRLTGRFTA